jgi:hypothetical protein
MSVRERLHEIHASDWKEVSTQAWTGSLVFLLVIAWLSHTGQRWVWFLDGANLLFHEAGHPIFGLLWAPLMVYGGTLMQLILPAVVCASFWARRAPASFAVAGIWLSQNLWNIARYMADARAQELPLVGSGEHDWAIIFADWGALHADTTVAAVTRVIGWIGALAAVGWLTLRWRDDRQSG